MENETLLPTGEGSEKAIAQYDPIEKIIEQLKLVDYKDEIGHPLFNNVAFISLLRMAEARPPAPQSVELAALDLARRFHETYERLAPQFGYATCDDTKAFDPQSPNGKLIIAVCGEIAQALAPQQAADGENMCEEIDRVRRESRKEQAKTSGEVVICKECGHEHIPEGEYKGVCTAQIDADYRTCFCPSDGRNSGEAGGGE